MALRVVVGVAVGVIWAGYMLALVELGSCDAFGGRAMGRVRQSSKMTSPVERSSVRRLRPGCLWWLRHPSRRQAAVGVAVALAVAVAVAFIARGIAHG